MLKTIINASHFSSVQLTPTLLVYYKSAFPAHRIQVFSDALNPAVWGENYKPFACVIIDQESHDILLVRDHLGVEPLFYCYQSDTLIFGNNLPDIIKKLPKHPALLDAEIINLFLDRKRYTDNTYYEGILRVEPAHWLHISPKGTLCKQAYWQLEREGNELFYADEQDYVDNFAVLLHEAVSVGIQGHAKVAAEFSAGLDSSAVYCAAVSQHIRPMLFMHMYAKNSEAERIYNPTYERKFLEHYQINTIQRITADDFDPIQVIQKYAKWFAGPAPHSFYMFAHNVHKAVSAGNYSVLLSGYGGDECVSRIIHNHFILPSFMHNKHYRAAWHALSEQQAEHSLRRTIKNTLILLKYSSAFMHQKMYHIEKIEKYFNHKLKRLLNQKIVTNPPFFATYFPSLRHAECDFLQGQYSYHLRMRIESSSIVSQKMGFQYRYPLLHPKLLAFFLSIPVSQKRNHGKSRYLMHRYLARQLGQDIFGAYKKNEGLHIFSAAMDKLMLQLHQGLFRDHFQNLPYTQSKNTGTPDAMIRKAIPAYMLKYYLTSL